MQINLKIEKKHIYFLMVFAAILFVAGVSAFTSPSTNVGHDPSEVGPGTFGGGSGDTYNFPGKVAASTIEVKDIKASGNITLGGESKSAWPEPVTYLPAMQISNGVFGSDTCGINISCAYDYVFPADLQISGNLVMTMMRGGGYNGIYFNFGNFTAATNMPHIISSNGLTVSSGTGSGKSVYVEGDMQAQNNLAVTGKTTTLGGLVIETRTSDPVSPETGRIWLRTDIS